MELSNEVQGGLQLAGDQFRIPDKCFHKLANCSMAELLQSQTNKPTCILEDPDFNSVENGVLKQVLYGLMTLFVEASKNGVETAMLQSVLDDCKVPAERAAIVCDVYQKSHHRLIKHLERYSFHLPRIVDVDWRLDYSIMSNVVDRINQPVYTIELKTQSSSSNALESQIFTCTIEELQDMVGKLKDAVKCWSKKNENVSA